MNENILEIKAEIFNALAHPMRLKILEKLRDGPCCVCKIIPYVGAEQSNVSHHLAILRNTGIVQCKKKGLQVWYTVTDTMIYRIMDSMDHCIIKRCKNSANVLKAFSNERR